MAKKLSKNLQKVQDMVDGTYGGKIQSGFISDNVHANRKVGERYFDSDDKEWEKTDWGRKSVSKLPNVGLGDNCSSCEKLIIKKWDKDVYKADGRCYHCQLNFEIDLEIDSKLRWFAYRRLKDFKNMESLEKDMEQWVEEITKERKKNPFDETVANALANGEIEMSIHKNNI